MAQGNPPVAVCTSCRKYTWDAEAIDQQCSERKGNKRCSGVFGSALNEGDWADCSDCNGDGCSICEHSGWEFVRPL